MTTTDTVLLVINNDGVRAADKDGIFQPIRVRFGTRRRRPDGAFRNCNMIRVHVEFIQQYT